MDMEVAKPDWSARRKAVGKEMQRRMAAHIAAGSTTDFAPAPMLNDSTVYTDPARLALEKRELFNKLPLLAGLSSNIPESGDMMLFEEAGPSIIIARTRTGKVNAFLNTCTHRGAKLVRDCTRRQRLTCIFHAWTFDLNGKVVGMPGKAGFEGVDPKTRGLVPVPVQEWNGMIFVIANPEIKEIDVEAYLGDFAPELAQLELGNLVPIKNGVLEVKSNWKYALDTYGEGYHFGSLHAANIGMGFYSDVAIFDKFGKHHRVSFPHKGYADVAAMPEAEWPDEDYGGIHFLFPNTVFFIGATEPGKRFTQIFRLFPGETPGETRTQFAIYAPKDKTDPEFLAQVVAAYDGTAWVVANEDYMVAAEGWASLSQAPKGFKVLYGKNEIALQSLHQGIAAALGIQAA
jgi:phenylpropionate dioxygenase-like ring-hydroxylating dioxygenase large terminal subunit